MNVNSDSHLSDSNIFKLPASVKMDIFSRLPMLKDLRNVALTCKGNQELTERAAANLICEKKIFLLLL